MSISVALGPRRRDLERDIEIRKLRETREERESSFFFFEAIQRNRCNYLGRSQNEQNTTNVCSTGNGLMSAIGGLQSTLNYHFQLQLQKQGLKLHRASSSNKPWCHPTVIYSKGYYSSRLKRAAVQLDRKICPETRREVGVGNEA